MKRVLISLLREEHGQDMVEYALILGFVAIAAAAILTTTGTNLSKIWGVTSNQLVNAASAATS